MNDVKYKFDIYDIILTNQSLKIYSFTKVNNSTFNFMIFFQNAIKVISHFGYC